MTSVTSRRRVLKGLGVTLGLPWLESLAPRKARAAEAPPPRWVVVFFPNGTPAFWTPRGTGNGTNWQLSPILEPIARHKAKTTVLTRVENYSPFGGGSSVEPSHSQLAGAFLTCNRCNPDQKVVGNAISADQVLAKALKAPTPFESLQMGLSTRYAFPDGRHPANSRSISWASATEPLYKVVNPQAVFDSIVSSNPGAAGDPMAERRRALRKSALDFVLENAQQVQGKLGHSDRQRLDQYLTSVRDLENRVTAVSPSVNAACKVGMRPPQAIGINIVPNGYNRNTHADLMLDLMTTALECDLTRVITFMLDDERSEYGYSFLKNRTFTANGSTETATPVGGSYHELQHAGNTNNGFATITRWNVEKLAQLCDRLDAVKESNGNSILDNSVVYFGSSMHGGNHAGNDIPSLYVGSGGGVLKTDQHIAFGSDQRLSDIYFTFMKQVFNLGIDSFANSRGVLSQILA